MNITRYFPQNSSHRQEFLHVLLHQIYFTFNQAVPLLLILGTGAGIAVAFQANLGLAMMGGQENLGKILVFILFREVSPLLTSIVIITRSVTAVTAEIATMKVGREIEALEVMGIDIETYLLGPRIWGGTISIFCMAFTFFLFSIAGAWLGSNATSYYPIGQFLSSISSSFTFIDFIFFFFKTSLIGTVVFLIGCQKGLSLQHASFEVPIVTNRAVVDCLFAAIFLQGLVSLVFYATQGIGL